MQTRCYRCMKIKTQHPICEHCGFHEQSQNQTHQLPLGTVLRDQYVIGAVLGQGGFGITYMGWDLNLEIPIAIKEYYPNGLVSRDNTRSLTVANSSSDWRAIYQDNRERFVREARVTARLREIPGITRVHNFFKENNTAYIIMEFVSGIDLRRYIKQQGRPLNINETLYFLQPIMYALNKVHENGIIHRDISPDNIMIQENGAAKLLDFGAVRELSGVDVNKELTRSTEAVLKHGFAPIEQYQKKGSLGPWTDIYALCATIHYCLTGKVPPDAPERVLENKEIHWEQIAGLTQRQIDTLNRGMALHPRDRIQRVAELYEGLYKLESAQDPKKQEELHKQEEISNNVPKKRSDAKEKPEPEKNNVRVLHKNKEKVSFKQDKIKKIMAVLVAALTLSVGILAFMPNGWRKSDGEYSYYRLGRKTTGKVEIDGDWYFFNEEGIMHTGWLKESGRDYYYGTDGRLVTGYREINGVEYYFSENGAERVSKNVALSSGGDVEFRLDNGNKTWGSYKTLITPADQCTYIHVNLEITKVEQGNADGKWQLSVRGGSNKKGWIQLADFEVNKGKGECIVTLAEPISLEAFVCTRIENDAWSGKMRQKLSEIRCIQISTTTDPIYETIAVPSEIPASSTDAWKNNILMKNPHT